MSDGKNFDIIFGNINLHNFSIIIIYIYIWIQSHRKQKLLQRKELKKILDFKNKIYFHMSMMRTLSQDCPFHFIIQDPMSFTVQSLV